MSSGMHTLPQSSMHHGIVVERRFHAGIRDIAIAHRPCVRLVYRNSGFTQSAVCWKLGIFSYREVQTA